MRATETPSHVMPRMFAAKMNPMDSVFGFNSSVIKSKVIDMINSILL